MSRVVIKGGTVVDRSVECRADVAIEDGHIVAVDESVDAMGATVLDASGCVVGPGLVDLHTHMREPGREEAETIETASQAAVLGGYTAVVAMPNTEPATDSVDAVRFIQSQAKSALCDVAVAGSITVGRAGEQLAPLADLAALGVRLFTDDGSGVQSATLMREALTEAKRLDVLLAQHCEDNGLSDGGHIHEGDIASALAVKGIPPEAEEVMVMRDIALARATGARVHFLHLSTAGSVALVRAAKAAGANITAEAAPHHFSLTNEKLRARSPLFKVNPPLRPEADRRTVAGALSDGTIDAVATDHAPWPDAFKAKALADAPCGMLGLQTALPLTLAQSGTHRALALLSWQPAAIAGLGSVHGRPVQAGEPANITVFDPQTTWVVEGKRLASKSNNTPYEGMTMTGRVRHTIVNGTSVVQEGELR